MSPKRLEEAVRQVAFSHLSAEHHGEAKSRIGRALAVAKDVLAQGLVTTTAPRISGQRDELRGSLVEWEAQ